MTNREWLETLSDKEFAEWVVYDARDLYMRYTYSSIGLEEWFSKEHKGRKEEK